MNVRIELDWLVALLNTRTESLLAVGVVLMAAALLVLAWRGRK